MLWGRDANAASRRVNTEMNILNVLEHDIHFDTSEIELGSHQYSLCALITEKMRSTSISSCKMPYRAALIFCSRD